MNEPITRAIPTTEETAKYVNKLTDTVTISHAEYELFVRDKTTLDVILNGALHMTSYEHHNLIETILKMRGMMA